MKICMVISTPFPPEEGIGSYVYGLSKQLIKKGNDVTIITRGSYKKTHKGKIDDINIIRVSYLPLYPFYLYIHGLVLNKLFQSIEKQFDIIHVHSPLCPSIKTSLPLITTIHTPMLTDTKTRIEESSDIHARIERLMGRFISYPVEMDLIKRADIITTVANSVALELKEYGLNQEEVKVIGNGVDENVFTPIYNRKNEESYILYTGRLDYRKGLFDLIESSKKVCSVYPKILYYIPGKGIFFARSIISLNKGIFSYSEKIISVSGWEKNFSPYLSRANSFNFPSELI